MGLEIDFDRDLAFELVVLHHVHRFLANNFRRFARTLVMVHRP